jgi:hypothetical protein
MTPATAAALSQAVDVGLAAAINTKLPYDAMLAAAAAKHCIPIFADTAAAAAGCKTAAPKACKPLILDARGAHNLPHHSCCFTQHSSRKHGTRGTYFAAVFAC